MQREKLCNLYRTTRFIVALFFKSQNEPNFERHKFHPTRVKPFSPKNGVFFSCDFL